MRRCCRALPCQAVPACRATLDCEAAENAYTWPHRAVHACRVLLDVENSNTVTSRGCGKEWGG
eukprot:8733016-Pyramimonas_sp.AAC.2